MEGIKMVSGVFNFEVLHFNCDWTNLRKKQKIFIQNYASDKPITDEKSLKVLPVKIVDASTFQF